MGRPEGTGSEAMGTGATAENLWTVRECAAYLRMSTSWVYKQVEQNAIPFAKLGHALRFHPQRVREYADTLGGPSAKIIPLRRP